MNPENKTFHILTFGCQMNAHDSDWLGRALGAHGWTRAPEDRARVVLVNTCSVREKPERKVYDLLGRLSRLGADVPGRFFAVGGCVAQQVGRGFFERYPLVRLVFGTDQTARVPRALDALASGAEPGPLALLDFESAFLPRALHLPALAGEPGAGGEQGAVQPETGDAALARPGQAFVSIMQGCDNFCAYCIVPYVRGRQKSRPAADVLAEVRALALRGVREMTLLGQNVNSYGLDRHGDGTGFAALLRQVCAVDGVTRVRFTTSHPKDLAPEVVEAFGTLPQLCPALHLPLQAGSDRVLAAMGRGYDMRRYLDLVAALRAARPGIALTTDLMVGFPGETEDDFRQTLEAMRAVGYESSFSFAYSDRPGTRSVDMAHKIAQAEKLDRLARLQALQEELTARALAARVGERAVVLLEAESRRQDGRGPVAWRGRDEGGRVVNVPLGGGSGRAGRLLDVKVVQAKKHSLRGEAVGEPW
ncbi:MiaB/RimO family radical SAM methylthiotransferase [Desulfocurvus vexinensis]|uniref:MiaB/RimO family radical SAM methylthiotransferase n=1 Tax=Desulfocurvus vexinensis TaxID=399548 RepID=UPI0004B9D208|nr:MiaB/RimO family radical SAM methylthiotransferase [Desulfocurvus vexinensis]